MSTRRGRGRPGSSNPDFLWVNRTPDSERLSATRQERDELRTITSHARQWRAALRRQQRLYSAQTEATHAQSIVGWGRQGTLSETSSAETSAAPSPAAMTHITGNSTDPFTYLESPDDAWWSHNAFRYAVESWLPSVFQGLGVLDEELPTSESCLATIDRLVQGCLASRMHMFSLLAASTGFLKYVLRLQLDRYDSPEYCMGKALQYLRHHLASAPQANESLIFDLKALSTFERYVNNFEGARTHLRMCQHLVQSLGGPEILEPPLRLVCWLWDLLVAGGTGETPLMPLTWDPGLLPRQQMRDEILPILAQSGVIPSGSGLIQYGSLVQPDLSPILSDIIQWFQVQQYNRIHNFSRSPIEQWATKRAHAIVHRLLSMGPASPSDRLQGLLSECIKQSFLIILADAEEARQSRAQTDSYRDPTNYSWSDVGRLRQALSALVQSDENWQERHEEIVLWMACLGVQTASTTASGPNVPATQSAAAASSPSEEASPREWFLGVARQLFFEWRSRTVTLSSPAPAGSDDLVQLMSRYLHRCEPSGQPDIVGLEEVLSP
ncbi:uncharacterized protein Z520_10735 [Fonsecaea multimorphosa CBS 102226]|uniref:Transcription factor domain-containing protein n=1 Tax=Fonsecaea multimorphosa CBS 102226 TaxID=1442371 RepID=A0A0D2JJZ8_9EURO|nr:uncharacterized protein Z520_10735 [Fonsecaea multimorphosa CBS 102226]KIX93557.1 hypothetical protein Z520_10735 [Fonsecaea multimorphosa CBS 102226]OAL18872.1 hypothetical protein AYO22_10201 [Fonsecaea multimorphosa]